MIAKEHGLCLLRYHQLTAPIDRAILEAPVSPNELRSLDGDSDLCVHIVPRFGSSQNAPRMWEYTCNPNGPGSASTQPSYCSLALGGASRFSPWCSRTLSPRGSN